MLQYDKLKLDIPLDLLKVNTSLFDYPIGHNKLCVDKTLLNNVIGLSDLYMNNDNLGLTISGKFNSSKGNLGYINRDNIRDTFRKFQDLGLFKCISSIGKVIRNSVVSRVDITKDNVTDNISYILSDVYDRSKIVSDKYNVTKYSDSKTGLTITPYASSKKHETLIVYPKYEELRLAKNRDYVNVIGLEYLDTTVKNLLRIELQLQNPKSIRDNYNIDKGNVSLRQILSSKINPLHNKWVEIIRSK